MSATPYRPDIDGLRAVAVLAVVAYHAWPHALPGGFVGVDVFFVISGFLITRILLAPGFSFASFYARRVRRIFPALLIVLAATVAIGATFLPPDNLRNLLVHTIGGGLFVANVVSYHDVGYFNGVAELKPLVHLWSLGVEEQFYLLWPVIVSLAARRKVLAPMIAIVGVASLALFLWWSERDPRAAFYLSPARFWELLAGAMLVRVEVPERWRGAAAAVGLVLIATSAALLSAETEFPGPLMIVPVVGACLVVASPGTHRAGRLLASRAAVAIGLISYPLYLWHWPLLSLLRNFDRAPSPLALCATIALSFVLAALTWRAVERPLLVTLRLRPVAASLAAAMLAGVGLATAAHAWVPAESNEIANAACTARYPFRPDGLWFCRLSKDAAPTVLLLGDSHANHLYDGIAEVFPGDTVLAIGACMPTVGLVYPGRSDDGGACVNERFAVQSEYVQRRVIESAPLRWVVLSAMWRSFDAAGREIDAWTGAPTSTFGPVTGSALDAYVGGIERQLDRIGNGVAVTIVFDTPRRGLALDVQRQRQRPLRDRIVALAQRRTNVQVLDPMATLCGDTWCSWNRLRDANHLSHAGSVDVARALAARGAALKAP
jgi:peptidoglycan/LPS O-acetylase OafA/YrhL